MIVGEVLDINRFCHHEIMGFIVSIKAKKVNPLFLLTDSHFLELFIFGLFFHRLYLLNILLKDQLLGQSSAYKTKQ